MAIFFGRDTQKADGRINAVPGLAHDEGMAQDEVAMLLTRPADQKLIGSEEIKKATEILTKYKDGKANLEKRIVDDELWWELRHWEAIGGRQPDVQTSPKTRSEEHTSELQSRFDLVCRLLLEKKKKEKENEKKDQHQKEKKKAYRSIDQATT